MLKENIIAMPKSYPIFMKYNGLIAAVLICLDAGNKLMTVIKLVM